MSRKSQDAPNVSTWWAAAFNAFAEKYSLPEVDARFPDAAARRAVPTPCEALRSRDPGAS